MIHQFWWRSTVGLDDVIKLSVEDATHKITLLLITRKIEIYMWSIIE